jgi:methyl-accepting chemotaxis protein
MLKFNKNKNAPSSSEQNPAQSTPKDLANVNSEAFSKAMGEAFGQPTTTVIEATKPVSAKSGSNRSKGSAAASDNEKVADRSAAGRLRIGSLTLALVPLVFSTLVVSTLAYVTAKGITQDRVEAQLESLRAVQTEGVQGYVENLKNVVSQVAALAQVVDATKIMLNEFPKLKNKPIAAANGNRDALQKYYQGDFNREFAKRNGGQVSQAADIFKRLPDDTLAAQQLYISGNENALGTKDLLLNANDGSEYSKQHEKIHPLMASLVKKFGMYDFFIVDPTSGFIVYTYFKELDYGTNLDNGPYAKTPLGQAFAASRKSGADRVWLSDFDRYAPSYNDQAAFMSVPIYDGANQIAVLAIQVPIEQINKVMTFDKKWDGVGLGTTGQSFLVGKDTALRSISREAVEKLATYVEEGKISMGEAAAKDIELRSTDIGIRKISSDSVPKAIAGEVVNGNYLNWNATRTLASMGPVKLLNQSFAMVTEMEEAEALIPVTELLRKIALAAFVTLIIVSIVALIAANRLTTIVTIPLNRLKSTVLDLQAGNFEARSKMKDKDEFGDLGRALDTLLDDRTAQLSKITKENEMLNNSVIEIMQAVGTIATSKDLSMKVPVTEDVTGAISDALNLLTDETSKVLRNVGNVSRDVAQATVAVKSQSELANQAAAREQQEVQFAATELATAARALNEIAEQARLCNIAAEQAVVTTGGAMEIVSGTVQGIAQSRDLIRETEKRIKRLGERSQEIGQVVNIIQGIAERTGILALNASMHAAAAGEAGRSFAVVADEVKRLSESARESTSQIGRLITAIQTETNETVVAMNQAITQVVEISRLADDAGKEMRRTQEQTTGLAASVRDIAFTSSEQAKAGAALQDRAVVILEASNETARQLSSQAVETRKLVDYAKSLLEEVRVFKVAD